jgi:hypothetical protein
MWKMAVKSLPMVYFWNAFSNNSYEFSTFLRFLQKSTNTSPYWLNANYTTAIIQQSYSNHITIMAIKRYMMVS